MSVSAFISNDDNNNINIPIATEKTFQDYWMPIINQLDLKWMACFQSGIEIGRQDLNFILKDLNEMQNWIEINMSNSMRGFMLKRIKNLSEELIKIFEGKVDDIRVYIG